MLGRLERPKNHEQQGRQNREHDGCGKLLVVRNAQGSLDEIGTSKRRRHKKRDQESRYRGQPGNEEYSAVPSVPQVQPLLSPQWLLMWIYCCFAFLHRRDVALVLEMWGDGGLARREWWPRESGTLTLRLVRRPPVGSSTLRDRGIGLADARLNRATRSGFAALGDRSVIAAGGRESRPALALVRSRVSWPPHGSGRHCSEAPRVRGRSVEATAGCAHPACPARWGPTCTRRRCPASRRSSSSPA